MFPLPVMVTSSNAVDVFSCKPLAFVSQKACTGRVPIFLSSSFLPCSSNSCTRSRRNVSASRRPLITSFSSPSSPPNLEDEGATVQDMEVFLNDLSLEYESVWDTKPAWCQPWTIVLTGCIAVLISWLALHSVIATALVTAAISAWWYIFLYSYPQAYTEMIAARRKRISDGDEDTYGFNRRAN